MAGGGADSASSGGRTVGLLCGAGLLPLRVAASLRSRGFRVVAIAIKGEADAAVESVADEVHWTGLAKLGQWIRLFKSAGADAVLMCGAVRKQRMFGSKAAMLPDWRTVRLWFGRTRTKEDHAILGAVADEFAREGMPVGSVRDYCPELLIPRGCVGRRRPTERQWRDIRFGWPIAKQVAALQIGQCIVVKEQAVVAVEGIDGTDATLERGGALAGGGAVAVKVPKESHDERFDIPCIGPETVEVLMRSGVGALAVQAGGTILLDADAVR
ncbi:MAG: hypothetical protein AMK73_07880, partial [Planctomycetes bacterium SM23_32]